MYEDAQLQQQVTEELGWEPSLTASHIGVMANGGIVTLSGHVESFAEKHAAEMAALRVRGVKGVAGEIEVQLPFDTKRSDDQIAAAAIDRLAWDTFIPADAIKVEVDNGWVTLTGEVIWAYQKEAAAEDVRRLFGVTGLSNQITIRPQVNTTTISDDIIRALRRSWSYPKTVMVSAEGGDIRLTGTVPSLNDSKIAEATAWAAPGAANVENNLDIA